MGSLEDTCTDGQIVTGEVITPAPEAPKAKKPRKARATSKFVVLAKEALDCAGSYPSIVAARKSIGGAGSYFIACLREEISVETTVPQPVTKVTVKRVVR